VNRRYFRIRRRFQRSAGLQPGILLRLLVAITERARGAHSLRGACFGLQAKNLFVL